MIAVKDNHITALNTQLEGKDEIIQAVSNCHFTSQADEKASADMIAVKDNHITALNTQLEGKDEIIQAVSKV